MCTSTVRDQLGSGKQQRPLYGKVVKSWMGEVQDVLRVFIGCMNIN